MSKKIVPMSPCLKSLHRLCADYDRLGDSSFLVDFPALDRWYLRAERVMEDSFAPAASDERVRTALCRCLTCYFYQPSPDRDDPWFTYLTATADAWAADSRDALLRRACDHYARRISGLARIPAAVQKRWQLLRTEGNALPLTSGVALP